MNNKKITSIIALAALVTTISIPSAFAGVGTVEAYYWQSDTSMCYNESSLDDLNFEDSTGNGDDVITEMEKSRSTLNAEMNQVDINAQGLFSCFNNHFDIQSESHDGSGNDLAFEISYKVGNRMTQSEIRFDSDDQWGKNSNTCTLGDIDVEWIMNHEMSHGIGLIHHDHSPVESMMHWSCDISYANLKVVDKTAIDINYS